MARRFALVEREDEAESSSEEEESEEEEEEEEEQQEPGQPTLTTPGRQPSGSVQAAPKIKIKIGKNDRTRCKVCGALDHAAGFVGATYIDCPNKPCYLCKMPGHTTATCPFKVAPGRDCAPATGSTGSTGLFTALQERETGRGTRSPGRNDMLPTPRYQVDAAIYKLHTRRCCTLEFHHSNDHIVISGDKKGGIAIWDFDKVHERIIYNNIHTCLCNQIKMVPTHGSMSCCTTSSDGRAKLVDLEVGTSTQLLDLNPQEWTRGAPWHMLYGCTVDARTGSIFCGDSLGVVHVLDARAPEGSHLKVQLHKKDKIPSLDIHPLDPNLLLTGGNDHTAKLFDIRAFSGAAAGPSTPPPGGKGRASASASFVAPGELACMHHGRVINTAMFSPQTGRKILTTCQNNRVYVWDSLLDAQGPASREIVHSHDFNRYLTPFKAEWDPRDPAERRFVIGRYISEEFNGVALHPIDIIDASSGRLLQELVDGNLNTICPVNKMHPRRDLIISGSSRSLYLWAPVPPEAAEPGVKTGVPSTSAAVSSGPKSGVTPSKSSKFMSFDAEPETKKKATGVKRKGAPGKAAPEDSDDD